jgi:hypothetical protein
MRFLQHKNCCSGCWDSMVHLHSLPLARSLGHRFGAGAAPSGLLDSSPLAGSSLRYKTSHLREGVPSLVTAALPSSTTHPSGAVRPPRNAHPTRTTATAKTSKGRYPLAPASHSPIFRAALVQTSAALRPFHFRCALVARVGIPLGLQLLPPTFARRRSACMYLPLAHSKANARATAQPEEPP